MCVDLEQEDDAAGFLGVTLERYLKTVILQIKQTGLIKRVIKELGLDNAMSKGIFLPSEDKNLVKDENVEPES